MRIGRVRADQQDHVGALDGLEILGTGGGTERLFQAIAGGRMADSGAGIDIVLAEGGSIKRSAWENMAKRSRSHFTFFQRCAVPENFFPPIVML